MPTMELNVGEGNILQTSRRIYPDGGHFTHGPLSVAVRMGRDLDGKGFQVARIDGQVFRLTAEECRRLAACLVTAADWIDGKLECKEAFVAGEHTRYR